MKRALLILAGLGILASAVRCAYRGLHQPKRHPLGGFVCAECHAAGADLGEMGFPGSSEVQPVRKRFARVNGGELTRSEHWDQSGRGGH